MSGLDQEERRLADARLCGRTPPSGPWRTLPLALNHAMALYHSVIKSFLLYHQYVEQGEGDDFPSAICIC